MSTTSILLLVIYVIGVGLTYVVGDKFDSFFTRVWAAIFWPATLILYIVHLIRKIN